MQDQDVRDNDPLLAWPEVETHQSDGIFIDWNHRRLVIMEFTRPMDGDLQAVRRADEQKDEKYYHLKQVLERALPLGWTVQIATFSVGVCGTMDYSK